MHTLGNGLFSAGRSEEALSVEEANLATLRRVGAPEDTILAAMSNMASSYGELGRLETANDVLRRVFRGFVVLNGVEADETLKASTNYAATLKELGRFEEAKSLLRKMLPVARRVCGEDDDHTVYMRRIYAETLYKDTSATRDDLIEAVTTLKELERTARRVLGGAHPTTQGLEGYLSEAKLAFLLDPSTPSPRPER